MTTIPDRILAGRMSETELQNRVREMCEDLGLPVQHIYDSRRSWLPGWPDLAILGNTILFAELKKQTGALSAEQRTVRGLIIEGGGEWHLWKPLDLLSGVIAERLARLATKEAA